MTNRIPLIVNAGAAQIQEVAASDTLQVPGNLTANVVRTDNYQYANGAPFSGGANIDLTNVSTNVIPSANVTYSLGNATNQWLDLWVSNATIYLNSIPLGVGNTGALQFDGNDIVTSGPNVVNTGNVETTGDVIGGNLVIATGGTLQFPDGSTQSSAYGNANVEAYLPSSNTIIAINSNVSNTNNTVANLTTSLSNTDSNVANLVTITTNTNSNVANLTSDLATTNNNVSNLTITVSDQGNAIANLQAGAYSNSNVASYLPTYTGNITADIIDASYLMGEGGNIGNIQGANVSGIVAQANIANVAYSVDGANVVGEVAVANTVSNPNQANITHVGTLTGLTINGLLTANQNAQFNGDVYFAGNVTLPGNINQISGNSATFFGDPATGFGALYAGIPAGYIPLINEVVQFADNYNGYTQVTHQNLNAGDQATGDYVITADNGNDTTNHVDLGIAGSGYNGLLANNSLGTSLYPNDSYLYAKGNAGVGGNLILGANETNGVVRIIANGASNIGDVVATFSANGLSATSFTGNGAGVANVDAITLQGAAPNTASSVNTIVQRDSSGRVSASGFTTAGTYLGEGNVYTESWLVANNMGVDTYQINVTSNANVTGNVNAGNVISPTILLLGSTSTITTSAGASSITVDPNGTGYSSIVVPTFQDGGEQLVIKNQFNSSNGVSIVTETGQFNFVGTQLSTTGTVTAASVTVTSTGTAINAGAGNILTNQVTGTQFNFLNGIYTVNLNGQGATANYTLSLPADAGNANQVLTTDGTGNLSWTTAAGSYGDSNVSTYLASGNNSAGYSTTGNVTAATFVTSGVSGNIQGANYVSANYFVGDGSLLTNLPAVSASIGTLVSGPNATPTVNNTQYNVTALAVSMNVDAPTGVPADSHKLTFRIIDNGTPQTLSWDPIYQVIGVTLPTTTVANKYVYVGCIYNAQDTTWDVVSVAQQS